MDITITYADLYDTVARSLSIIGKRSTDDNGNLLFRDITLGTRETEIAYDYLRTAAVDMASELTDFISVSQSTDAAVTITVDVPTNWNQQLLPFLQSAVDAYCVAYTLYSWFVITAPRIADKYLADAQRQKSNIIRLAWQKKKPAGSQTSPFDISSTVTRNS